MTIDFIETFVATPLYLLTPCRYPTKLTSRTLSNLLFRCLDIMTSTDVLHFDTSRYDVDFKLLSLLSIAVSPFISTVCSLPYLHFLPWW